MRPVAADRVVEELPLPLFRLQMGPADVLRACVMQANPVAAHCFRHQVVPGGGVRVDAEGRVGRVLAPVARAADAVDHQLALRAEAPAGGVFHPRLDAMAAIGPAGEEGIAHSSLVHLALAKGHIWQRALIAVDIDDPRLKHRAGSLAGCAVEDNRRLVLELDEGRGGIRFGQGKRDLEGAWGRVGGCLAALLDLERVDPEGARGFDAQRVGFGEERRREADTIALPLIRGGERRLRERSPVGDGDEFALGASSHRQARGVLLPAPGGHQERRSRDLDPLLGGNPQRGEAGRAGPLGIGGHDHLVAIRVLAADEPAAL